VPYNSVAGVFAQLLCLHTTHSNGVMLSLGTPTAVEKLTKPISTRNFYINAQPVF
jgi:hypothetical protein